MRRTLAVILGLTAAAAAPLPVLAADPQPGPITLVPADPTKQPAGGVLSPADPRAPGLGYRMLPADEALKRAADRTAEGEAQGPTAPATPTVGIVGTRNFAGQFQNNVAPS